MYECVLKKEYIDISLMLMSTMAYDCRPHLFRLTSQALLGYVLQSHVRALLVTDASGMVLVRSVIRLLLRSDTLTPIIFCDPMFFTLGYSKDLQRELLYQVIFHLRVLCWVEMIFVVL